MNIINMSNSRGGDTPIHTIRLQCKYSIFYIKIYNYT